MPVAKVTTSSTTKISSTNSKNSEKLELALAISKLTSTQESFMKAVSMLEEYKEDKIKELDLSINAKKEELSLLENEFTKQQKDQEIKISQYLSEFKRKGAIDILKENNEEPILSDELKKLKTRIEELEESQEESLSKAVKEEKDKADSHLKVVVSSIEMKHKAETAELTAQVKQQQNEIVNLKSVIDNLKTELAEQRKLTQAVAEAGKMAPITVNSGK
jgi:hypothetical protein